MSALELKGKFIKLLAEVEDAKMLEQMLSYCLALASGKHSKDISRLS